MVDAHNATSRKKVSASVTDRFTKYTMAAVIAHRGLIINRRRIFLNGNAEFLNAQVVRSPTVGDHKRKETRWD